MLLLSKWNRRHLALLFVLASTLLLVACPKRGEKLKYDEAERGLQLAIKANEAAYNSWHQLREDLGKRQRNKALNRARWASLNAIDGVIVDAEANLIVGIDRSKKLLAAWHRVQQGAGSAAPTAVTFTLSTRQDEARQRFLASTQQLLESAQELRDSYAEALYVMQAIPQAGQPLSRADLKNLKALVRLVDKELGPARLSLNNEQEKAAVMLAAAPEIRARNQPFSARHRKRLAPTPIPRKK